MEIDKLLIFGSPGRYIQGPGAVKYLGYYVAQLSQKKRAWVLIDVGVDFLTRNIETSLREGEIYFSVSKFEGDNRLSQADKLSQEIQKKNHPDVIVGVGGGKTIDMSKMIAHRTGAKNIIVPTIAATDAPTSCVAVAVDENGKVAVENHLFNPDLILVDSEVIAKAPLRYFVSGIGDAISRKYEVLHSASVGETNYFGGQRAFFITDLLEVCHRTLLKYGTEAKKSIERKETNDIVEKVITSIILLSGLLFENGGLAAAHSIANVLFNQGYGKKNLHGELVAVGILLQIILEKLPAVELNRLDRFFLELGLPRNLTDLGVAVNDQQKIASICEGISARVEKHGFRWSSEQILQAIQMLDEKK
jgi:glycerol dehydrogenase